MSIVPSLVYIKSHFREFDKITRLFWPKNGTVLPVCKFNFLSGAKSLNLLWIIYLTTLVYFHIGIGRSHVWHYSFSMIKSKREIIICSQYDVASGPLSEYDEFLCSGAKGPRTLDGPVHNETCGYVVLVSKSSRNQILKRNGGNITMGLSSTIWEGFGIKPLLSFTAKYQMRWLLGQFGHVI